MTRERARPGPGGKRRILRILGAGAVAAFFAVAGIPAFAAGPEVRGSVSAVYENLGDGSDSGLSAAGADSRLLERLRVDALQLAPGIDFHGTVSLRQWQGGERDGENATRLSQSFFEYRARNELTRFGLRAGRQWMYEGGTSGILDGASMSWTGREAGMKAFLGSRSADDDLDRSQWPDRLESSRWWGISGRVMPSRQLELTSGYSEIRRFDVNTRELLSAGAGIRIRPDLRIRGEVRYDMVPDYALSRTLRATWRPDARRELWMEAARKRPDLEPTSFLARFRDLVDHDRDELRLGGRWTLPRDVGVSGAVSGVDHRSASPAPSTGTAWNARDSEHWSIDATTGFSWRGQSVGYWGSWGYGGARNAFFGAVGRDVHPKVRLGVEANLLDYRYGNAEFVEDEAAAYRGRIDVKLDALTRLRFDVELLDNAVSSSDLRFLVRATRGFRFGGSGKGGSR